jgi:hypothetical protein
VSAPQHMVALQKANVHRLARAGLHREVAAMSHADGLLRLAELIEDPPPEIVTLPVGEAVRWVRLVGASGARMLLRHVQLSAARQVGALTPRQRRVLVSWLRGES